MSNIIQQMKVFEAERERMFAIYCADTGAGDMHRPFDNYRAGYEAATSHQEAKIKALVEALEKLACLGNGDKHGNSIGNCIAIDAINAAKETP